ncbi:S1 domain-containing post-transcriptional regulator GSP13 [Shouchella sp. 1P09AA]|uniref:S1 domain-containing post-transcriptional regulator GSP13 n=1 Tax=unclassified Shouchella TaxID=2893065 RepID=UPI0039A31705
MSNYEEGSIIEGKVTGIKPFGAFVAIDEKKQGLVHISEVAHGYVKDIADVLTVGDEVKVKVMSVDQESGKISLSIRATQEAPARPQAKPRTPNAGGGGARKPQAAQQKQQGFNTLEDKLKEWLKQSNEIQADLNKRAKK